MLVGQGSANCNGDEIMMSAYCARSGNGTGSVPAASLQGMTGASCEGEGIVTVLACVKR
jgi:hypothetical protein